MAGTISAQGASDERTHAPLIEIVSAGNEVLIGDVLDTNTNWLCVEITRRGGFVRRTTMLRDDVEAIAAEVRSALARRPAILFTVGGLGPTSDDRTLEGVALGLGVELRLNPVAERLVAAKYAEFHALGHVPFPDMNESRRKMARLPAGAEPLRNPIGGAPGVLYRQDDTAIVSLPGVPGELRAIFADSFDHLFGDRFGAAHYEERALVVATQDESAIAADLARAEVEFPEVYIKSRARQFGSARVIRVTLSARGRDATAVAALLTPAAERLQAQITAAGFAISPDEDGVETS
ncbi:MAG: molybdopterin-binding protein [Thermoleophilia bacterium]